MLNNISFSPWNAPRIFQKSHINKSQTAVEEVIKIDVKSSNLKIFLKRVPFHQQLWIIINWNHFSKFFRNIMATNKGPWPCSITRNWSEARQEIQAKLYWGPCYTQRNENKEQVSLLAPLRRGAGSSHGRRVRVCPGVGLERWLRWSAHPFGGVECRGHG